MTNPKADLLQSTLDMIILKALSLGPPHGYSIIQRIRRMSDEMMHVEQGALYPALYRLEAKGWVAAVILLGVLIIEDQLEGHLLQPQVVGRVIRLHPLAIILSLAVGSVLAGIAGAVVAVPIVAVITRAVPELRRRDPAPGGP